MSTEDLTYPELLVTTHYGPNFLFIVSLSIVYLHLCVLGDHFYKRNKNLPPEEQMISALPDVKVLTLNEDHEFMVIACDGIW